MSYKANSDKKNILNLNISKILLLEMSSFKDHETKGILIFSTIIHIIYKINPPKTNITLCSISLNKLFIFNNWISYSLFYDGYFFLYSEILSFILSTIENKNATIVIESPRKLYIAFRVIRNFMCVQVYNHHLLLYLGLNPEDFDLDSPILRDVSNIGHYGTGDLEVRVEGKDDVELAKKSGSL